MQKRKKHFSEEFKQDAVNHYYLSGKSMKDTSSDLKISQASLNNWVQNAKSNDGIVDHRDSGNYSSDAEKELRDKEDTLDILKKAIGILNEN